MGSSKSGDRPAHHHEKGGFRNPARLPLRGARDLLRWQRERSTRDLPPNPPPESLPLAEPQVAHPAAPADELRITWVGHATFLLQIGGLNVLTDPHWSERASPVQFAGPRRFVPPGIPFEELPPIDVVVISHDHYDHLDASTVRRLVRKFGDRIRWITPLRYKQWMRKRGAASHIELDWWESADLTTGGRLRITALPAQHWTSRQPWSRGRRLWASWSVAVPGGASVYFAGDTGYFPEFANIGAHMAPFDAVLLPIGAYDPSWFMQPVHMNPEEAVAAYRDLGSEGLFCAMHWGTWRLTDEDPLEPPLRAAEAWREAGLPEGRLWIARHGETQLIRKGAV
jgi:N-acyl-phosphatidylethanolamine-hydrolysing phospholipase D